jgi:hypothetical protein
MTQSASSSIDYQEVIEAAICQDSQFPCTEIFQGTSTSIYRIDTPEPLIVRIYSGSGGPDGGSPEYYEFQSQLLDSIATPENVTPRILYWEMREIDGKLCGVEVQTYLRGDKIDHYPTAEESRAIADTVYGIHKRLYAISSGYTDTIDTFDEAIRSLVSEIADCLIKSAANRLLENPRYNDLLREEQCLIDVDMWQENLLFDQSANGPKVRKLDLTLFYAPRILQPACLYSSFYLMSFPGRFHLDEIISYWPEPLDRQDLLLMMQPFLVGIGALKEFQLATEQVLDPSAYRGTIELCLKCLDLLSEQMG